MVQATLYIHTNVHVFLKYGEVPTTLWNGADVDKRYITNNTLSRLERDMERTMLKGLCLVQDCTFSSQKKLRLQQHVESYNLCYICSCDYFALYRDITVKHGKTRHHHSKPVMTKVDTANWHVARWHVARCYVRVLSGKHHCCLHRQGIWREIACPTGAVGPHLLSMLYRR